jgi:hypothetical protein
MAGLRSALSRVAARAFAPVDLSTSITARTMATKASVNGIPVEVGLNLDCCRVIERRTHLVLPSLHSYRSTTPMASTACW